MTLADCAVFLLVTILVNGPLSPVLPATYEPLLIFFARLLGPLPTAVLGTAGTIFVEYLNYHLHQRLLKTRAVQRVTGGPMVKKVVTLFRRRPAFTVWLCAWSPLPYWPVRLLSPMAGLSLSRHLVATALGRFPQYLVVILLGSRLHLSTGTLNAIILGSTLLALTAWLVKRLWRRRPAVGVALIAGMLVAWGRSGTALAQRIPDGKALGITVDRFRVLAEGGRYTTITFHVTPLDAGGLSSDFAIGIFPTAIRAYVIASTLDAGIGYNISLPRVTILPRIGASSLFEVGLGGYLGLVGYHAGVSVLINFGTTSAIRLDITRREYFPQDDRPTSSLSIGVGISGVQPRPASP